MNELAEGVAGITGGSWITSEGHACLRGGKAPRIGPGKVIIPPAAEIFDRPPQRYGRFDRYTKLGCAALALAWRDAGLDNGADSSSVGMATCSVWDTMSTDQAYCQTSLAEGGRLASPNLFTYTLPGVMQGECAVLFGLTGPTICIGEDNRQGVAALNMALRLLAGEAATVMIAGWLDDPPETCSDPAGALFVVLERRPRPAPGPLGWLVLRGGHLRLGTGQPVNGLADIWRSLLAWPDSHSDRI